MQAEELRSLSVGELEKRESDLRNSLARLTMKRYARHGVNVNVDFYAGVVYYLNGIASDLFVPIFAIGRVPGWTVQVLEQMENNILIRPLTLYNGPQPREYLPLDLR